MQSFRFWANLTHFGPEQTSLQSLHCCSASTLTATKCEKSGSFLNQISVTFGLGSLNVLKSDPKISRFFLLRAYLTNFKVILTSLAVIAIVSQTAPPTYRPGHMSLATTVRTCDIRPWYYVGTRKLTLWFDLDFSLMPQGVRSLHSITSFLNGTMP